MILFSEPGFLNKTEMSVPMNEDVDCIGCNNTLCWAEEQYQQYLYYIQVYTVFILYTDIHHIYTIFRYIPWYGTAQLDCVTLWFKLKGGNHNSIYLKLLY